MSDGESEKIFVNFMKAYYLLTTINFPVEITIFVLCKLKMKSIIEVIDEQSIRLKLKN